MNIFIILMEMEGAPGAVVSHALESEADAREVCNNLNAKATENCTYRIARTRLVPSDKLGM